MSKKIVSIAISFLLIFSLSIILSPKIVNAANCIVTFSGILDNKILPDATLSVKVTRAQNGKTYRFRLTPTGAGGIPVIDQSITANSSTVTFTITVPNEERRYFYSVSELRSDSTPENCNIKGTGFIQVTSSARTIPTPSPTPSPGQNPCGPGGCPTALGNIPTTIQGFAGRILGIAIGLAGGLALILMVIGSVRVLTSSGDQQKLAGGRDMIVAAVAGLLFLIFSVLILRFIGIEILRIPGFGG